MGNDIIRKYVMKKTNDGEILHSSGLGRVQAGGSIGTGSVVGNKRFAESERKYVGGYDKSGVMGAAKMTGEKPKTYTPPIQRPTASRPLPPKR